MQNKECLIDLNKFIYCNDGGSVYIKIPKPVYQNLINDHTRRLHKIIPMWIFDEDNYSIISPKKTFYLTKRESVFLKMLLIGEVITYEKMLHRIWDDNIYSTKNAIKSFVKNLKKKLPPGCLKNFNGIGYQLIV